VSRDICVLGLLLNKNMAQIYAGNTDKISATYVNPSPKNQMQLFGNNSILREEIDNGEDLK